MIQHAKHTTLRLLRWSEKYTKTDMVYLFNAGFWNNLNAVFTTFFSLLLYIAFAHFLSKETYGTYQYLLSFFSIATGFTLTGMNAALTRAVAQGKEGTIRASIPIQLKYGMVPFFGALVLAGYYAYAGNHMLALGLIIIGIFTPLLYTFNSYNNLFIGRRDFRSATIYSLSGNIFYYGGIILAAALSGSPLVVLGANLIVQTVIYMFLYWFTLKHDHANKEVDKEALSFGLHLSGMNVFGSVAGQLGGIFIFHFLGPVSLALYSFASAPAERLGSLSFKFLGSALLPKFAERSVYEIRSTLLSKMFWTLLAGTGVAIVYAILCPFFFIIFFPAYISAIPLSMACGIGLALAAPIYLPIAALTALRNTRGLYIMNIINPIAQIMFPITGILLGGLWGFLIAHLLSIIFMVVSSTILVFTTGNPSLTEPA